MVIVKGAGVAASMDDNSTTMYGAGGVTWAKYKVNAGTLFTFADYGTPGATGGGTWKAGNGNQGYSAKIGNTLLMVAGGGGGWANADQNKSVKMAGCGGGGNMCGTRGASSSTGGGGCNGTGGAAGSSRAGAGGAMNGGAGSPPCDNGGGGGGSGYGGGGGGTCGTHGGYGGGGGGGYLLGSSVSGATYKSGGGSVCGNRPTTREGTMKTYGAIIYCSSENSYEQCPEPCEYSQSTGPSVTVPCSKGGTCNHATGFCE